MPRAGRTGSSAPPPATSPRRAARRPAAAAASGGGRTLPISDIKLGEIRIENGTLTYDDARSGTSERIEAINLSLDLPDLQSPPAGGGLARPTRAARSSSSSASSTRSRLIQGGASPLRLAVDAELLQVGFMGEVSNDATPGAAGGLDLAVPSIRELAAWLAQPIAFEGEGLQKLAIKGQLDGAPTQVAFTDATIALDAIEGQGELLVELAGAVPKLSGRLDLGAVDLDPYLTPEAAPAEGRERARAGERQAGHAAPGRPVSSRRRRSRRRDRRRLALPRRAGRTSRSSCRRSAAPRSISSSPSTRSRCASSSSARPCSACTLQGNTLEAALEEFLLLRRPRQRHAARHARGRRAGDQPAVPARGAAGAAVPDRRGRLRAPRGHGECRAVADHAGQQRAPARAEPERHRAR